LNFLHLVGKNPQLSAKTYETEKWEEKQDFLQYNLASYLNVRS
jgi:hypothetical protein